MKIFTIFIFFVCINAAVAMVNVAGEFNTFQITPLSNANSKIVANSQGDYSQSVLQAEGDDSNDDDLSRSLSRYAGIATGIAFPVSYFAYSFGAPLSITATITILYSLLYGLALVQFIGNRNVKGMR